MNIFVGNLSDKTTSGHLSHLFIQFGKVLSVKIIRDSLTGRSLGYGFVEMDNRSGAMAIQQLDRMNFMNHYMEITEAGI